MKHPIAVRLRDERRSRGIPQTAVAIIAGIGQNTVCRVETGECSPSLAVAEAMARALGLRMTLVPVEAVSKYCPDCDTVKPPEEFGRDRGRADGIAKRCGACTTVSARARQMAVAA